MSIPVLSNTSGVRPAGFEARGDPLNLDTYAAEVESGLPNEKAHLDSALENQAFYDREGERYLPQRDAESTFDFMGRPKRQSGVTHEVVEVLTENLYSPG